MEAIIQSVITAQVSRRAPRIRIINISVAKCMNIHAKLYTSVVSKLQVGRIHLLFCISGFIGMQSRLFVMAAFMLQGQS